LTRLPVVALINTHPHPENVLGNSAFGGKPIYATADAATAMGARCGNCQERLARTLGRETMRGTRAIIPDQRVSEMTEITLGGRSLRLLPLGTAHSPGDLTIVDTATGTLVGGDVVTIAELPDLRDGTLRGWIKALERLQSLPHLKRVLPGRGAPFRPEQLSHPLDYLRELHAAAMLAADSGEWPPRIARETEFAARFSRFAELHPLNLQHALREAEDDWLSETRPEAPNAGATNSPSIRR
jgi:glyoxylase-like metal-dependent hydrolase (beta-lactamase superfamily II)